MRPEDRLVLLRTRPAPSTRLAGGDDLPALSIVRPADAQAHCNFVVFTPLVLPAGCAECVTSLRPEAPPGRPEGVDVAAHGQTPWSIANPCSLRTVISGGGRSLRLKQFLYDWAPNPLGAASLWDSPAVTGFRLRDAIAWRGVDYHETAGASVVLDGTTVELSVIEGPFEAAELEAVLTGLVPADPEGATMVRSAPFHALNYWVHYRLPPLRTPYGLWAHPHRRAYDQGRRLEPGDLKGLADPVPLLPGGGVARVTSAFLFDVPQERHREVEMHLDNVPGPVWMTAVGMDSERTLACPPTPEDHPAELRCAVQARQGVVWLAALSEALGPWEAIWEEGDARHAAWFGSSPAWTRETVLAFLEGLAPP